MGAAAINNKAKRYQDLPQFDDWFRQADDGDDHEDDPWIDLPIEHARPSCTESTIVTERSNGSVVEYSEDAANMARAGLQQIAPRLKRSSLSEARTSVLLEELHFPTASKRLREAFHPVYNLYKQELCG